MDIWQWLYDSIESNLEKGDESRLEWYHYFRRGNEIREDNPEAGYDLLEEARRRAATAGDSWWVLFLEHWKLQNLLSCQRDYGKARDLATRVAVEARKPQYAAFPQRVCLQEDLISSVVGIDARGHAHLIEDALQYMEREADSGTECTQCLLGLRADFERERGDYPAAYEAALQYLARSEAKGGTGGQHHALQAHLNICSVLLWVPFENDQLLDPSTFTEETEAVPVAEGFVSVETYLDRMRGLEAHAHRAQELAEKLEEAAYNSEIAMWRAYANLMLGDMEQSEQFFKSALDQFFNSGHFPNEGFFLAWRMVYFRLGQLDQGLRQIEEEEKWIAGKGQKAREARLARTRCQFKLLAGILEPSDFELARTKIAALGAPEYETERLDELETAWKQILETQAPDAEGNEGDEQT